jgi:hypothetical protein
MFIIIIYMYKENRKKFKHLLLYLIKNISVKVGYLGKFRKIDLKYLHT